VEEFDEASRRVADLQAQRSRAGQTEGAAEARLGKLRDSERRYRELKSDRDKHAAIEAEHRLRYDALRQRIDAIRTARADLATLAEALRAAEESAPATTAQAAGALDRLRAANARLVETNARLAALEPARAEAADARDFVTHEAAVRAIDAILARVREYDASLVALRAKASALLAPTQRQLVAIEKADRDRREAHARLDAALITIEIVPAADVVIDVRVAERPGKIAARAGVPLTVRGAPEVVIDVPGAGLVRASGPAGSLEDLRSAIAAAESEFQSLTRPLGATDLAVLQARLESAGVLAKQITQAEARREAALDGQTIASLSEKRAAAEAAFARVRAARPEWADAPPDAARLADALRARSDAVGVELDEVMKVRHLASEAKDAADAAMVAVRTRIETLTARMNARRAALGELESDSLDDAARAAAADAAALAWQAAGAAGAGARAELQQFAGDPADEVQREQRNLDAQRKKATATVEQEKMAEGRLESLARLGVYSRLAELDEQIAAVEEELGRQRLRAAAVKLLRDTVVAQRQRATAAVSGPVEAAASDVLRRIGGGRLGRIGLGENFAPGRVAPASAGDGGAGDKGVELDVLSGGEREQIHLAVRLALAQTLSKEGNHLVVLDDVLIATDAARLNRVQAILEEFAADLQILVLTCHPERYYGMNDCRMIDLEQIVGGS
jgi:hypothetical protein